MMNGDPPTIISYFESYIFRDYLLMNFYQSVFPEKMFSKTFAKKAGSGVITFQYLLFLVRATCMPAKVIFSNLDYICHKSMELQRNLKHFKFWYFFTV